MRHKNPLPAPNHLEKPTFLQRIVDFIDLQVHESPISYTCKWMNPSSENFEFLAPGTHPRFLHPQVYEFSPLLPVKQLFPDYCPLSADH
jgi:hypothetical protein